MPSKALCFGGSLAFIGKTNLGFEHLEKAIADIDPEQYRSSRYGLGITRNMGLSFAYFFGGWLHPDRA
jgi:hypothetical protein